MRKQSSRTNQEKDPQARLQKMMLFSLSLALLMPTLGMSIANVALPVLSDEFAITLPTVNWVVIAYLLPMTSLILGAGALGDRFGKKRILLTGVGVFSLASILGARSDHFALLLMARLLQGLGAAFLLSQTIALAGSVISKQKTGMAMGLLGTIAATGTALGPVVGGLVLEWLAWPFIFWLMLPLGGLAYYSCLKFVPDDHITTLSTRKYDYTGTALLALSCLFYALAMSSGKSLITPNGIGFMLVAVLFFVLFVQSQKQRQAPLVSLSLLDNNLRNSTLLASFVIDAIAMATLVIGPFYLTLAWQMSPAAVGIVMSTGPFIAAIAGYPSGKLVDYFGVKPVMLFGLCQVTTGTLCFAFLPLQFGIYGYIAALLVLTPGRQLFLASNYTFVINSVSEQEKGIAAGLLNLCKNLGLMTGASLIGGIFALLLKSGRASGTTEAQLNSAFSTIFFVSSLFAFLALIGILISAKKRDFTQ